MICVFMLLGQNFYLRYMEAIPLMEIPGIKQVRYYLYIQALSLCTLEANILA